MKTLVTIALALGLVSGNALAWQGSETPPAHTTSGQTLKYNGAAVNRMPSHRVPRSTAAVNMWGFPHFLTEKTCVERFGEHCIEGDIERAELDLIPSPADDLNKR